MAPNLFIPRPKSSTAAAAPSWSNAQAGPGPRSQAGGGASRLPANITSSQAPRHIAPHPTARSAYAAMQVDTQRAPEQATTAVTTERVLQRTAYKSINPLPPPPSLQGRELASTLVRTTFRLLGQVQEMAEEGQSFEGLDGPEMEFIDKVAKAKSTALHQRVERSYDDMGDALLALVHTCVDDSSFGRIEKLERRMGRLRDVPPSQPPLAPLPAQATSPYPSPSTSVVDTTSTPTEALRPSLVQDDKYNTLLQHYTALESKYTHLESSFEARFSALEGRQRTTPIPGSTPTPTPTPIANDLISLQRTITLLQAQDTITRKKCDAQAAQLNELLAVVGTRRSSTKRKADDNGEVTVTLPTMCEQIDSLVDRSAAGISTAERVSTLEKDRAATETDLVNVEKGFKLIANHGKELASKTTVLEKQVVEESKLVKLMRKEISDLHAKLVQFVATKPTPAEYSHDGRSAPCPSCLEAAVEATQRMDHLDEDIASAKEVIQKLVTEGTVTIEFIRALEQHGNVKVLVPQLMSAYSKISSLETDISAKLLTAEGRMLATDLKLSKLVKSTKTSLAANVAPPVPSNTPTVTPVVPGASVTHEQLDALTKRVNKLAKNERSSASSVSKLKVRVGDVESKVTALAGNGGIGTSVARVGDAAADAARIAASVPPVVTAEKKKSTSARPSGPLTLPSDRTTPSLLDPLLLSPPSGVPNIGSGSQ